MAGTEELATHGGYRPPTVPPQQPERTEAGGSSRFKKGSVKDDKGSSLCDRLVKLCGYIPVLSVPKSLSLYKKAYKLEKKEDKPKAYLKASVFLLGGGFIYFLASKLDKCCTKENKERSGAL